MLNDLPFIIFGAIGAGIYLCVKVHNLTNRVDYLTKLVERLLNR